MMNNYLRSLIIILVLLPSYYSNSIAFELAYTSQGKIIKRLSGSIGYYYYYPWEGAIFLENAIRGAMGEWNNVGSSNFTFNLFGPVYDAPAELDGQNKILFTRSITDGALGENLFWYYIDTGDIFESDILISPYISWSNGGYYDLRTVLLHEIGHTLHLAHSTSPGAVMGGYYHGGRNHLTNDDIAGISHLFPAPKKSSGSDSGCFITTVIDKIE